MRGGEVSDLGDEAERAEAIFREEALHRAAARRQKSLLPTGACFFCRSPVHVGLLFCDVECRDDYEREVEARARNGER